MAEIFTNPGFLNILEDILTLLNYQDLKKCHLVNNNFKKIVESPLFWIKSLSVKGMSEENKIKWTKAFLMSKNLTSEDWIFKYLRGILKRNCFVNIPCYIDQEVITKTTLFTLSMAELIQQFDDACFSVGHQNTLGIIQILAPMMEEKHIQSTLHQVAEKGQVNIIEILAHFTKNLNAPDENGWRIIQKAMKKRDFILVKALIPFLTYNANAPDPDGFAPIHYAVAHFIDPKIIGLLAPISDNLADAKDCYGWSAIECAVWNGNIEYVRLLAPLSKNPNAPSRKGAKTPMRFAVENGNATVVRILGQYCNNINEKDENGESLLQMAIRYKMDAEMIKALKDCISKEKKKKFISLSCWH